MNASQEDKPTVSAVRHLEPPGAQAKPCCCGDDGSKFKPVEKGSKPRCC